jgi:transposase-like protein
LTVPDGNVLDILVQNKRETAAAKRFFREGSRSTPETGNRAAASAI